MLNFRQRTIIDFVMRYWVVNYVGPSVQDLVDEMPWCNSKSTMHNALKPLVRDGYLMRPNGTHRALVPLRDCDGTQLEIVIRRVADGVEAAMGEG